MKYSGGIKSNHNLFYKIIYTTVYLREKMTDELSKSANAAEIPLTQKQLDRIARIRAQRQQQKETPTTSELFRENFTKCVRGYHLINNDPIKETPWEDINAIIMTASGLNVVSQSNGSHKSGGDISCSMGSFSNKSTQYDSVDNNSFKISSYRLTTVCSDKSPGAIEDIIAEINKRKNFTYYSIIVRQDNNTEILYDWYLIPSDFPALDPASYQWHPKLGKTGKNKDTIVGWETNVINGSKMSITFSMSSQLWLDVSVSEEMRQFVVGSCRISRGRKYNYIQLYEQSL